MTFAIVAPGDSGSNTSPVHRSNSSRVLSIKNGRGGSAASRERGSARFAGESTSVIASRAACCLVADTATGPGRPSPRIV